MPPHEQLAVWRKAHALTLRAYEVTERHVARPYPALAAQLRRAAHAVAIGIADGAGEGTPARFDACLQGAMGRARELSCCARLACDLGVLPSTEYAVLEARADEVLRMLAGLRRTVVRPRAGARRGT